MAVVKPFPRAAQRRPGPKPRRQCGNVIPPFVGAPTLNEGRGRNPGDRPRERRNESVQVLLAQRRPGPKPRRQPSASASTRSRAMRAQRRPGPKPRRQFVTGAPSITGGNPAQRRPGPKPRRQRVRRGLRVFHRVRRSTKAGAETPATVPTPATTISMVGISAQRRPGPKPRRQAGDRVPESGLCGGRSTKAGAETPATATPFRAVLAGVTTAQRRPGPKPRRQPPLSAPCWPGSPPLNEGRGRNPGDSPRSPSRCSAISTPLNEGRGRNPGDRPVSTHDRSRSRDAQRRPGPKPRRQRPTWA